MYTVFTTPHPLTVSFMPPWMICRFKQKLAVNIPTEWISNFYIDRIYRFFGIFSAISVTLNLHIIHGNMKQTVIGCFFFWTQCRYIYSGPKLYTLVVSCVLWTTETRELDKFDQEWGEAREELWLFHWRQHSIGYLGDGFTGQKTQQTVSKYWRDTKIHK